MPEENQENENQSTDGNQQENEQHEQNKEEEKVSAAEFRKIQEELRKARDEVKHAKETLKNVDLEQMKAQERWKEISELREKEANEYKDKYEGLNKAVNTDKKMNAIRLAAQDAGIRREAVDDLELYDFPEVFIETTSTGRSQVIGAKEAIENLKVKKPFLFEKRSSSLNSGSPSVVSGGSITIEQVKQAQMEYSKTKSSAALQKYQDVVQKFRAQQRQR